MPNTGLTRHVPLMPSGASTVLLIHHVTGQLPSAQHLLPRSSPSPRPESLQGLYNLTGTWRQRLYFALPCKATIWHSPCFCDFGSSAILASHYDSRTFTQASTLVRSEPSHSSEAKLQLRWHGHQLHCSFALFRIVCILACAQHANRRQAAPSIHSPMRHARRLCLQRLRFSYIFGNASTFLHACANRLLHSARLHIHRAPELFSTRPLTMGPSPFLELHPLRAFHLGISSFST